MGFSGQGYWSGLPCPPPGDLPNPGIEPRSPTLQEDPLLSEPPGKYIEVCIHIYNGTPLQHSCLENPTDRGAWWAEVHGVVKSRTRLSDFPFAFHFHSLEKEVAPHSSVFAWRIPGTGEPDGLPSMGSHRVRHD